MSNEYEQVIEVTPSQKLAGNLVTGGIVILCGVFLLLCGVNVIPLKVKDILLGTFLGGLGVSLFINAWISKNSVSLWLSVAFIVPSIIEFLTEYTALGYRHLYPLYIAIPAFASVVTCIMTRKFIDHLYVVLLFGVIGGIFALESSGLFGFSVVVPCFVIYFGAVILLFTFKNKKEDVEDEL